MTSFATPHDLASDAITLRETNSQARSAFLVGHLFVLAYLAPPVPPTGSPAPWCRAALDRISHNSSWLRVGGGRPLAYIGGMEFAWDEGESALCFSERGFDLAHAVRVSLDPDRLIERDDRFDYGEPRYRALGQVDGRVFVVFYTPRSGHIRLISARKANQREVRRYEASTGNTEV